MATTTQTGSTGAGMQAGMGAGPRTPNVTYDLISVMYHALQGCETYERYAQDAEQAGQQDIAQFFRDTKREFERCAERGEQLLAQCLQQGAGQAQAGRSAQLHSQSAGSQGQQGGMSRSSGTGSSGGSSSGTR